MKNKFYLSLMLLGIYTVQASDSRDWIEHKLPQSSVKDLSVEIDQGQISITGNKDNRVSVFVRPERKEAEYTVQNNAGMLQIQNMHQDPSKKVFCEYKISIPELSDVNIQGGSALVSISGIKGNVNTGLRAGTIDIREGAGSINLNVARSLKDGCAFTIKDPTGDIKCNYQNGLGQIHFTKLPAKPVNVTLNTMHAETFVWFPSLAKISLPQNFCYSLTIRNDFAATQGGKSSHFFVKAFGDSSVLNLKKKLDE